MKYSALPLLLLPTLAFADPAYRSDWTYQVFYNEIAACRAAVYLPAAQAYAGRARQAGRPEESIRNEVISVTPMLEATASTMCYCAMNEIAKSMSVKSFKADPKNLGDVATGAKCKAEVEESMAKIKVNQGADLRLK